MKVLIVGSYPPPYGGVTMHVKRLANLLSSSQYTVEILDVINRNSVKKDKNLFIIPLNLKYSISIIKSFISSKIVHIHTSGYGKFWREAVLITLAKMTFNKVIITIHGGSFPKYIYCKSLGNKFYIWYWLRFSNKVILVNQLQKDAIDKLFSSEKTNDLDIIPAFLPENIGKQIHKKNINSQKDEYDILVMGNWMEVYGLDTFIHAIKILKDKGINAKGNILIYIFSQPDIFYKNKIETLIENLNLKNDLEFIKETDDMSFIYNKMDLFIRPTHADGDSISVREAVSYNLPVIASDVCKRPASVILFEDKNPASLAEKIEYVIKNYNEINIDNSEKKQQLFSEKILDIYHSLF